jgi:hypothetical protein
MKELLEIHDSANTMGGGHKVTWHFRQWAGNISPNASGTEQTT